MREFVTNLHFIRPAWLTLMPVAVAVWWLWRKSEDPLRGWRAQMDQEILQALVVSPSARSNRSSFALLAVWMLAIAAIAGPTWKLEPSPFAADAAPLMILLKADKSMELSPPTPSRLERARLFISDLAKERKGQPLGLIAYAGSAHLVLPPTRDTSVVAEMAAEISPEIMPAAGDRLDLAIQKANTLLSAEQEGGAILVIADSAEIDPKAVASITQSSNSYPVQILGLTRSETTVTGSLEKLARAIHASIEPLSLDDPDANLRAVTDFAERRTATGIAGNSDRWQEAGYWLTPAIALVVALSFRKQQTIAAEDTR